MKSDFFRYVRVRKVEYIEKDISCEQVAIQILYMVNGREKKRVEEWTVYSMGDIGIRPDLCSLGQTLPQKVSIAIPINHRGKGITKGFDTENYAYYTLPVMPTGFSFKYNASKLYTTSGRSEFVTKEGLKLQWNLWQMNNLAKLLVQIVKDLITKKTDPRILYQIIPTLSEARHIMDEQIFNLFKLEVESNHVLMFYTSDGIWRQKSGTFMNWDGLEQVLPEDSGYHFVQQNLKKFTAVFQSYEIGIVGIGELVNYLERKYGTSPFESNNSEAPAKIARIFEYLGNMKIEPSLMERLKKICILLTEEGILRSYEYGVYFPTDDKMPLIHKGDILNHLTYNALAARRFLEKRMKIKRMDLHYLISDSFLRRIGSYNNDQKFEFIWYLVKRQRDVCRKKNTVDELRRHLQDVMLVEKGDDASDIIFFGDPELKEIFENKLNYLSPQYEEHGRKENTSWRNFLKKIGVEEYPSPERITDTLKIVESTGFNEKNVKKANALLRFLEANWRAFYSKKARDLIRLNEFKWIPTDKRTLEYPTNVYANKSALKLVGESHSVISIKPPKNMRIVRVIGLPTEARLEDVIKFILATAIGQGNAEKPRAIPFMVYSFVDKRAEFLTSEQIDALKQNRTILLAGKLWKPSSVFLEDCRNDFGPNGWLRVYVLNAKFSKLERLCYKLGISRTARFPDDYIEWLADFADVSENLIVDGWKASLVHNAYSRLAMAVNSISEEQLEKLRSKKSMLTSELVLKLPHECYLLRRGEDVINEIVEKSGIKVPIVKADNAEYEKLYHRLGVNEIASSFCAKRVDTNEARLDQVLTERFNAMIPWLDGFEFSSTGAVSENNLIFAKMKVYRVDRLKVQYTIRNKENDHQGTPIEDLCCFERNQRSILFLDQNFSLGKNEHIHLLSINLTKDLSPSIDKIGWNLAVTSLIILGKILGVSPYDREARRSHEISESMVPEERTGRESTIPRLEKLWTTEEKPVITHETPSQEMLDERLDEATQTMEEESWNKPIDISKLFSERKHISQVKVSPSVRYSTEPKITAPKNWKLELVEGEEVYVEEGITLPASSRIRSLRRLTRKIVEVMGLNPETVNICIADVVTDGYNQEKQLFFNAAREDSPYRWFGVVARELAYNYSHMHYPHVRAMVALITRGLENIEALLPEFEKMKDSHNACEQRMLWIIVRKLLVCEAWFY